MEGQEKGKKNFGIKHLPLKMLKWIKKGGFTKREFFELYPDFDFRKEGFPLVFRKQAEKNHRLKKLRLRYFKRLKYAKKYAKYAKKYTKKMGKSLAKD